MRFVKKSSFSKFAAALCALQACAVFAVPEAESAPEPAAEPAPAPVTAPVPAPQNVIPIPDNSGGVPADDDRAMHETLRYSYLGVALETLPAANYSRSAQPGIQVVYVIKNSPAAAAGLRVGDILLSIDGQKLFFPNQFSALVRSYEPGTEVEIEFLRGGERIKTSATVGERKIAVRKRAPHDDNSIKDDIRLYINGREFSFGDGSDLDGRISLTPHGILIGDRVDIPAEFRRLVARAHSKIPDSRRVLSFLQEQYEEARDAAVGKTRQTFSQIFFGHGNSVVIVGDERERRITVSSADDGKVLFRGNCTTQEEIDAIPADAKAIIDAFTVLKPLPVPADAPADAPAGTPPESEANPENSD